MSTVALELGRILGGDETKSQKVTEFKVVNGFHGSVYGRFPPNNSKVVSISLPETILSEL